MISIEKYSALYLFALFLIVFGLTQFHLFFSQTTFKSTLIEKTLAALPNGEAAFAAAATEPEAAAYLT